MVSPIFHMYVLRILSSSIYPFLITWELGYISGWILIKQCFHDFKKKTVTMVMHVNLTLVILKSNIKDDQIKIEWSQLSSIYFKRWKLVTNSCNYKQW